MYNHQKNKEYEKEYILFDDGCAGIVDIDQL